MPATIFMSGLPLGLWPSRKYMFWHCPRRWLVRTLKRIGGEWRTDYHPAVDGDKYVCMDRIISTSLCLIYSYGIRDDWTFEDYMAGEHSKG